MQFVQYAPERGGPGNLPIKIALMTQADADYWHTSIQADAALAGQADAKWNWSTMRRWLPVTEMVRGRRAPAYVVWAEGAGGAAVPIGMNLLSEGYSALHDGSKRAVFIWFMAAAPESSLHRLGVAMNPKLGRTLIDIGVTHSHNCGFGGCIGLHAAPGGGQDLIDKYEVMGLTRFPERASLPVHLRKNDGGYFYLDEPGAQKWSNSMSQYR